MVECIPRADLCVCLCGGGGGGVFFVFKRGPGFVTPRGGGGGGGGGAIFRDSQWGPVIVNPLEGEVGGYWLCRDKIHLIPPCDSVIFL